MKRTTTSQTVSMKTSYCILATGPLGSKVDWRTFMSALEHPAMTRARKGAANRPTRLKKRENIKDEFRTPQNP